LCRDGMRCELFLVLSVTVDTYDNKTGMASSLLVEMEGSGSFLVHVHELLEALEFVFFSRKFERRSEGDRRHVSRCGPDITTEQDE
jgi:hypothetical protein